MIAPEILSVLNSFMPYKDIVVRPPFLIVYDATRAATEHQNGGIRQYKTEKRMFRVLNDPGLPKNVVRHGEAMSFVYRRVSYDRP